MRVLIVTRLFPPNIFPEAVVSGRIARALSDEGVDVRVLTCRGNDAGTGAESEEICRRPVPLWDVGRFQGTMLGKLACAAWYALSNGCLPRYASFVHLGMQRCQREFQTWRPDVIFARGNPASAYYLGFAIARRWKVPLVLHFGDPWPDDLWPYPYKMDNGFVTNYEHRFAKRLLRATTLVSMPSRRQATLMKEKFSGLRNRRVIITPHPIQAVAARVSEVVRGTRRTMHLVHAGTLNSARTPSVFLDVVCDVQRDRPGSIKVSFVGHHFPELPEMVRNRNLEDIVELKSWVPYNEAAAAAATADALVLIDAPTKIGVFLPSKFVDYLSWRKPIIALTPMPGEVYDYMRRTPFCARPDDPGEIRAVIDRAYDEWMLGRLCPPTDITDSDAFQAQSVARLLIHEFSEVASNWAGRGRVTAKY